MSENRIFFVSGLEGSGTTMLTEALVTAGCYWEQEFENIHTKIKFSEKPHPLVIHRSYPHAGIHYSMGDELLRIKNSHTKIISIIINRDENARILSVYNRDKTRNIDTIANDHELFIEEIGNFCHFIWTDNIITLSYESFVNYPGFRKWFFEKQLELPYPEDYVVYDGNAKYYQE